MPVILGTNPKKASLLLYPALIAIQILFGINFVAMKAVVSVLPPLLWASIRVLIAALLMIVAAILLKRKRPPMSWSFLGPALLFSVLAIVIAQGAVSLGLKYTTATNSALLNTLIPIFALLIVTLRGQEALSRQRAVGFGLAFLGVLILRRIEQLQLTDTTLIGDVLILLSCLSTALFLSFGKKFTESFDRVWTTAWLFIFGGVGLGLASVPSVLSLSFPALTPALAGSMLFVVLGGTLSTYFLSVWSLAQAPSSSVAIFVYFQPIVAAFLTWLMSGEVPERRTLFSSVIIFLGVVLVIFKPKKRPPQTS